jgi:hypothetical protein
LTSTEQSEQGGAALAILRDIERAARNMTLEWPEVVDSWEDLASEIVSHLLDRRVAVNLKEMDPGPRKKTLTKIAQQLASGMRDQFEHFNGNFKYSTTEVRKCLEDGAIDCVLEATVDNFGGLSDEWLPFISEMGAGREVLGREVEVEGFDIRVAFSRIGEHHQAILIRRFVTDDELSTSADRMRVTRAIDELTATMNRAYRKAVSEYEGPGSRPRISTAKGLYLSRGGEES